MGLGSPTAGIRRAAASAAALALCTVFAARAMASDPAEALITASIRAEAARPSQAALQLTMVSPVHREAVIDGRHVQVGDRVGNARVVAIEGDAVRLRDEHGVTELKLIRGIDRTAGALRTKRPASPSGSAR